MSGDIPTMLEMIDGEAYEGLEEGDEGGEDVGGEGKRAGGFHCELLGQHHPVFFRLSVPPNFVCHFPEL